MLTISNINLRIEIKDILDQVFFLILWTLIQYNIIRCYINLFTHDKQMVYCKLYYSNTLWMGNHSVAAFWDIEKAKLHNKPAPLVFIKFLHQRTPSKLTHNLGKRLCPSWPLHISLLESCSVSKTWDMLCKY